MLHLCIICHMKCCMKRTKCHHIAVKTNRRIGLDIMKCLGATTTTVYYLKLMSYHQNHQANKEKALKYHSCQTKIIQEKKQYLILVPMIWIQSIHFVILYQAQVIQDSRSCSRKNNDGLYLFYLILIHANN